MVADHSIITVNSSHCTMVLRLIINQLPFQHDSNATLPTLTVARCSKKTCNGMAPEIFRPLGLPGIICGFRDNFI